MSLLGTRLRVRKEPNQLTIGAPTKRIGEFFRRASVNHPWEPWPLPGSPVDVAPESPYQRLEITRDDIHPGPPYRSGGPFLNVKVELPSLLVREAGRPDTGTSFYNGWIQQYRGGFVPLFTNFDPVPYNKYADADQLLADEDNTVPSSAAFEPEVYPKLRPKLEKAGLTVSLAELRDLPRMLQSTAKYFSQVWNLGVGPTRATPQVFMAPKRVADDFLNVNFGWIPFVSDLRRLRQVYENQGQYISRITRENGLWHKRKWVHDESESTTVVGSGTGYAVIPSGPLIDKMCVADGLGRKAYWQMVLNVKKRVWSEGSFKYYRPEFDDTQSGYHSAYNQVSRYLTLYGLRISPSTVYNATPWSWLVDWASNVGDHVDRVTDWGVDGIVARYMYLMTHFERRLELTQVINFRGGPIAMTWTRLIESKQRQEAGTPYGFGLASGLSARQIAILAALGLSRKAGVAG